MWSKMVGVLVIPPDGPPYFCDTDNLELLFREVENLAPADRLEIRRHLFGVGTQTCSAWFTGREHQDPNLRAQALLRSAMAPLGTVIISGCSRQIGGEATSIADPHWEQLLAR